MQKTAGWSNTNYGVVYGEKKLNGDANEGAHTPVGTWGSEREYLICAYAETTPGAFAAVAWDNSFFKGVGASNYHSAGRVLIDYGIGGEKSGGHVLSFFPGAKIAASALDCLKVVSSVIFSWDVRFLFNGTIQKAWQGSGNGLDTYLIILERAIL